MRFSPTPIEGVFIIDLDPIADHRGFFARLWSESEFAEAGLAFEWVQCNVGHSTEEGTIRGLHHQRGASAEAKLAWCGSGALFDVAVDLRPGSPTRLQWVPMSDQDLNWPLIEIETEES
jgi:dTDP-4-dehydrorhamnose 3,5-epimerase